METLTTKKSVNRRIRPIHRGIGTIILVFTLYFAVTGTVIQFVDLRAILSHAPATDPEMAQVREGLNGPGNYVVIQASDYAATPFPENFDFSSALNTVLYGARKALGDSTPLKFVELRNLGGKSIGLVRAGEQTLDFDAVTGAPVPSPPARRSGDQEQSVHATFKLLHTLRVVGNWITFINALVALSLFVMIVTGLVLYFQLLRARTRAGLKGFFWSSGGAWRSLHRAISLVAALFLLVVSTSGTMLALDAFGLGIYQLTHKNAGKYARFPIGSVGDFSSPLPDAKLPDMLQRTLSAGHSAVRASPIKVVRLRYFNGIPQGVLIAGSGDSTAQLVFNTDTGKPMSLTEPGYPKTHYRFGWQEHELMKKIHRGDAFGVPGRLMDLFAGLSLIYLSISGGVMYANLWRRRRSGGRTALFWM
jgi:uncharacterized iron-regulated membrane protein